MFLRLLLLFTIVPLVELFLLVQLGRVVGAWPTIALVLCTGVLGAALARHQGLGVVRRLQSELQSGGLPADALIDGLLILVAAAVLLTPGLLTDVMGFVLLVPRGRRAVRSIVGRWLGSRFALRDPNVIDAEWRRGD